MLRYLLRILVVVLLVQQLEARLAAPSLLDSVKSAAGAVASAVGGAAKMFGVTSRAKFNGAAGRLKDTDQSCVMCQYFVQRIQGYSILYAASNPAVMLEESAELRPLVRGTTSHQHLRQPQEMSNAEYAVYLEIIRRLHEEGEQAVEKQESKREAHARKHFDKNGKDWVTPEFDEATDGKGKVLANELPDANMHAEDIENNDGKGNTDPDEVPADEKTAAAASSAAAKPSPSPAFKQTEKDQAKAQAKDQTTVQQQTDEDSDATDDDQDGNQDDEDAAAGDDDNSDSDDDNKEQDQDAPAAAAADSSDDNDDDDNDDDSDDDAAGDDDQDQDQDSDDSAAAAAGGGASLLETKSTIRTKSKTKVRGRKTKFPVSGYSGRYRVSDQKLYRPVPARFAPVHPYLPNAAAEASRMRLNQMYQLVYASFQTICTLRQPFEMAQYCGELESRYRTVAEGLRYGDRPDEICMEIDMCDKDAYIRSVAHAMPPAPTSPKAWIPIASNILLNYPEDQALTNLKLALTDFNQAQTASILLQAGLIAVNQEEEAMGEAIRILGKFSGQKPANWVKEKAYQLWVLATIIAKGNKPSATEVQQAAAEQAQTYLDSTQDNSGAILRLVTKFAADGYTAARTDNNDVQSQFVSLITDQ